ncbi:hypothetical protein Moror_2579 [Moniliophthora roreri MCA 2997]|uniref:RNA-dependent RNA polymerase n=1 Tax=Moniliophthora roreri (strain MCA 2997) TaxID=1381753 RepID=V2XG92_MONRO|nr:hypothetical protein Moror_2579 [Moniliophthora roreri MCA 2997]
MYCYSIGITLHREGPHDVVEQFYRLFKLAELPEERIIGEKVEVLGYRLFSDKPRLGIPLRKLRRGFQSFDWPIVFQLESLLFHGILHTSEVAEISNRVLKLCREQPRDSVAALLRTFNSNIPYLTPGETVMECFEGLTSKAPSGLLDLPPGNFNCYHVTFTPTRMITEGPYPTQSHRIIRRYKGFEDHFIRVDFREEDRTQYGDDREVNSIPFLNKRVGKILKDGFPLGGQDFQFLAYSSSGLRNHSLWFMSKFNHPLEGRIDAARIRDSIGDFRDLLRHPSKYGARLGLAFTATRPSVKIRRDQWEIIPDIVGEKSRLFTDGIGSISEELGDEIWEVLHEDSVGFDNSSMKPSAYMIRFLGFKGVVTVDKQLGKEQSNIRMRLRPSMRKFGKVTDEAEIEIAQSFERPSRAHLNKQLIMILEDKGVKQSVFMDLLNDAIADVYRTDDTLEGSYSLMKAHLLGLNYRLPWILEQLERLGCCIGSQPDDHHINVDYTFLKELRKAAQSSVLREIKNDARIPIPDSYLLVGVADEGPAYRYREHLPSDSIYELREGEIYACIQETSDDEPQYLEGPCAICRSPLTHPGDVQRVQAIGRPPAGKRCFFAHMKNVVVFSCNGKRPLSSCLGGGDLDGDPYIVIRFPGLLPPKYDPPASYDAPKAQLLSRECNIGDVCDFVVTYIHSNVLGLLSTRLLTIADQSKYGIRDRDCLKLAELCSQAVDYAKHGVAIDLESNPLPKTLMRCKPDWRASNDPNPRETDYYTSTRALGYMYRECLKHRPAENNNAHSPPDALSSILKEKICPYLDPESCIDRNSDTILRIFHRYRDELRYICNTHILSETSGSPSALQESEVVMGTILTRYTDKNWRKDRTWRMKLHTKMLVRDVKVSLKVLNTKGVDPRETLELAWCAWEFSSRRTSEFGTNSFGMVALDCLLQSLERLSQLADA